MSQPDSRTLDGKVAMVTGGARGIGRAIAVALARAGADVAVIDIDAAGAAETADMVRSEGRQGLTLSADVADREMVERAVEDVTEALGRLSIGVNNAGVIENHTSLDCTDEQWRRVMAVNLDGVFWCCRAEAKRMIAQGTGGRIINIGSMSAHVADWPRRHLSYSVSKAGVVMMTRYLAVDWAQHGITVNSISPGNTETPMIEEHPKWAERWRELSPLKRLARPEEIAAAAVFLAGDAASYVNGHDLLIDSGFTCR